VQDYRARRREGGFTLIELLVVIAIIALLIGILLPAIGKARDTAKALKCQTNNRGIGTAMLLYANDYKDWFPVIPSSNPNESRADLMSKQQSAGGVAGLFSLFQVGDAEFQGYDSPPVGDRGYIGAFGVGLRRYANGSDQPLLANYIEAFEVLTCPLDREDSYFGWSGDINTKRYNFSGRVSKVPTAPTSAEEVISYNISYLYFAGLRPNDADVLTSPVIWGDETNTNDVATNAFYGYNWAEDEPGQGQEPQAVLDELGFNPATGYAKVDNHGDEGGYFVFSDGHVEFITQNPQRTFFADYKGLLQSNPALAQELKTEAKSINLFNPDRSRLMRTID